MRLVTWNVNSIRSRHRRVTEWLERHEPHVALFAGETGLDVLTRLIAEAESRLSPGGWLLSEISPVLREEVIQAAASHPGLQRTHLREDLARQPRVLCTQRRS